MLTSGRVSARCVSEDDIVRIPNTLTRGCGADVLVKSELCHQKFSESAYGGASQATRITRARAEDLTFEVRALGPYSAQKRRGISLIPPKFTRRQVKGYISSSDDNLSY